ncbi:hypothetical protein [Nocardia bhagyanarayanae]|uniref:Uncharacterized protein n=1 Tax=Nocardia bhagyanarayanae TaxID=1215925 RepID=A0A543FGA7_9NOCA|nr:hypothetical protein [Nocardia bhagyanarayanae]TQM32889.1 hypothetical protein FB390_4592 [Nocardia bhagyanarayanae]
MTGGRLGILANGLRNLRRAPDIAALRAAGSPEELARLALIPAARNMGIAIGFLGKDLRAEATAALLACRVLDAYEDLIDRPLAGDAVRTAAEYLTGGTGTPPPPPERVAVRDSEAVDLVLAERIPDVRALVSALPVAGQERVGSLLLDIGDVMARNLDSPLPRVAYSEGVLGRVTHYACTLVAEEACAEADLRELTACVGVIAQAANDLRDGEFALYGVADRAELTRAVMLRLLAPALGGFALLARLGPRTPHPGARAAMAYMTITTTGFLCTTVGAPVPYRRPIGATALAILSPKRWAKMVERVQGCADAAIHRVLDTSPELGTGSDAAARLLGVIDPSTLSPAMVPLIIDTTFALVRALPDEPLTGKLSDADIRTMMIADHLAFGALDRLPPRGADEMRALATSFQLAALDSTTHGGDRP